MIAENKLWQVSILNDDVNLASFVVLMLMRELDFSHSDAEQLTLQTDEFGGATVFTGDEDSCHELIKRIHSYGIQAVIGSVPGGVG